MYSGARGQIPTQLQIKRQAQCLGQRTETSQRFHTGLLEVLTLKAGLRREWPKGPDQPASNSRWLECRALGRRTREGRGQGQW